MICVLLGFSLVSMSWWRLIPRSNNSHNDSTSDAILQWERRLRLVPACRSYFQQGRKGAWTELKRRWSPINLTSQEVPVTQGLREEPWGKAGLANYLVREGRRRQLDEIDPGCPRVDCTQSLSFLLVLLRLEWARCATAREAGVSEVDGRATLLLARSSLSITVDEKRKGLRVACPRAPQFVFWGKAARAENSGASLKGAGERPWGINASHPTNPSFWLARARFPRAAVKTKRRACGSWCRPGTRHWTTR